MANFKADYFKGFTLLASLCRAMTRDPIKYKDPEVFNPERFLTEEGELNDDEVSYAFGFGRRFVVSEIST